MTKKICVIGGGPGGFIAALRSAQLGEKVTLVEKDGLGGTCLNWGCIPSKIMKATSELFEKTKEFENFGILLNAAPDIDMEKLQLKKTRIIDIQKTGIKSLLTEKHVEILMGTASFVSKNSIRVTDFSGTETELEFDKFIIAAGTKIKALNGFEFNHKDILSSDDLLSLDYIPESIAIVGGGIIGCEFASILNGLDSDVSIIEAEDRLLPVDNLDKDISKALAREYKKKKIKIFTDSFAKIKEKNNNGFILEILPKDEKKKSKEIKCSKIAVCTGRVSAVQGLEIEKAGVKTDESGWIKIDNNYRTSNENIYAIGDILGPEYSMLAHTASFEGRVCAEIISGNNFTGFDYSKIPGAIFSSPEIGFIGHTEETAKKAGFETLKEKVLFRTSAKAHAINEIAGEAVLIADKKTEVLLGIHIIGPHASDLLGETALAVQQKLKFTELANTVHAHPTLSEVIMEAGLKLSGF